MDLLLQILPIYVPNGILLAAWLVLRKRPHAPVILTAGWFAMLILLAVAGGLFWEPGSDFSRVATCFLAASTIWLTGPVLISLSSRSPLIWPVLVVVLVPYPSVVLCGWLMLLCGHVAL